MEVASPARSFGATTVGDAWMYSRRIRLSMPLAFGPNLHDEIMTFLYTDTKKLVLRRAAFVVLRGPMDCQF